MLLFERKDVFTYAAIAMTIDTKPGPRLMELYDRDLKNLRIEFRLTRIEFEKSTKDYDNEDRMQIYPVR